jgi:hypothetical protein
MTEYLRPIAAAVALTLSAPHAFANTTLDKYFTFNGFASAGVARTDTDEGQFIRDGQTSGATTDLDYNLDTNLGLQLTGKATDWLSGTVQVLTMQRDNEGIEAEVEWAYVKVQPIKSLSLMAGRMGLPMFLVSDSRNVGYANTWLRPPNEVYGMALYHRLEGANLSYSLPIRSSTLTVSALKGESEAFVLGTLYPVDDLKGLNITWEADWLTLRAGRVSGINVGPNDNYVFSGIGASADHHNVVAQAEFVTRRSKSGFGDIVNANGWYALTGYRFNQFLPYVSYADTAPRRPNTPFHLTDKQTTAAAGLRWDAFSSTALKLQVERIDTHDTAGISFSTPIAIGPFGFPGLAPVTKPVMAVSLAMDVVF